MHPSFEIVKARRWKSVGGVPQRIVLLRFFKPDGRVKKYSTSVEIDRNGELGIYSSRNFDHIQIAKGDFESRDLPEGAILIGEYGGKVKRIARMLGNPRPCPGHIPGECGSDIHHERGCRMISWSKCQQNPVNREGHPPKRTAVYAAKRNTRIKQAEKGRRLR